MKTIYAIFILAIGLSIAFSFTSEVKLSPDAVEFDTIGWNLAQDNGFTLDRNRPDATREPLYPFFLSLIYRLFGRNYRIVQLIQAVLVGLIAVLTYRIGQKLFNQTIAGLGGLLVAVCPAFIAYGSYLWTEVLFTFLLLAGLERAINNRAIIAGVLLGLAILCKAALILLPFFLLLSSIIIWRKNQQLAYRLITIMLIAVSIVLPWTIRNYKAFDTLIPVRTGSGISLWIASYLPWDGESLGGGDGYPEVRLEYIRNEPLKSLTFGLDEVAVDKKLSRLAMESIRKNPKGFIKLSLKRAIRLWQHPIGEVSIAEKNIFLAKLYQFFHYLVLLFALVGVVKSPFRTIPITAIIIYFTLIYAISYAHPRYQFPILPLLGLLTSNGFISIVRKVKQ